jgi:hypothetical protein
MDFLLTIARRFKSFPSQLRSLLILFAILVAAFIIARHVFVPESFGEFGHYRAAAVDANASRPLHYAGSNACMDCHDDIFEQKSESFHKNVSCEVCHGPAVLHTEAPDEHELPAPRKRGYCTLCHGYNPSRPTGFPQIEPATHNPLKPCFECHDPHDPKPPHTPEQCSACHRNIAMTKAVSHHAQLQCTKCHDTPQEHKVKPLAFRPKKPSSRAFCGQCHARDADSPKNIPRIDLSNHHVGYVCWQCHYPHYPEAG